MTFLIKKFAKNEAGVIFKGCAGAILKKSGAIFKKAGAINDWRRQSMKPLQTAAKSVALQLIIRRRAVGKNYLGELLLEKNYLEGRWEKN